MPVYDQQTFLEKISPDLGGSRRLIAPPTLEPLARLKRRLAFRNQIYIYPRTSAFSGATVFSMFTPDNKFPVITPDEWFGESWDGLEFGANVDFGSGVFDQIARIRDVVPHMARSALFNENCDFCSNLAHCKNCYLIFNSTHVQDSMYGENFWQSNDCVDGSYLSDCELCFDCICCERCYNLQSSWDCEQCTDSFFLLGCRNCTNCFGCVNLRRKQYYLFNEPVSKEKYEAFIAGLDLSKRSVRQQLQQKAEALWRSRPRPHVSIRHAENVSGNYLYHCKDLENCFFVRDGESLRNCSFLYGGAKDCQDYTFVGLRSELMYESVWCALDCSRCSFCFWCLQSQDLLYCLHCVSCKNCFGCAGLRNKQYCVFNKQYSKEAYNALVPKIIDHMAATKEWGEFFPVSLSPVPYNHSIAQRFFPLSQHDVAAMGGHWYDKPLVESSAAIETNHIPDTLPATDSPLVLKSSKSGSAFRVTAEELKRYRAFVVPLPTESYDERMTSRALRLGGLELCDRVCARTGRALKTNYSEESGWIIWDRDAYESEAGE